MKTVHKSTLPLLTLLSIPLFGLACAPPPSSSSPPPSRRTPPARASTTPKAAPSGPASLVAGWTLKTKGQLVTIAGRRGSTVYLAAGDYLDNGMPTRWVYALDATTGKASWIYTLVAPRHPFMVKVGDKALALEGGGEFNFWITWDGKKQLRPPKASLEDKAPNHTVGCNLTSKTISCRNMDDMKQLWTHTYANALSKEKVFDSRLVCFAEAKTLLLRCLHARTGKPLFAIKVPQVPKVKYPARPQFTYIAVGGWLVVANYNNVVTGYAIPKK